jgi:hypothetical protein
VYGHVSSTRGASSSSSSSSSSLGGSDVAKVGDTFFSILRAGFEASNVSDSPARLERASDPTRSLPPSSALSFERALGFEKPIPLVVLAEYDDAYVDRFHGSSFDVGADRVDPGRMASVAASVARAAALGSADDPETARRIAASVDETALARNVRELVGCLIDPSLGFACPLARKLFAARESFPSRYAGVAPPAAGAAAFDAERDGKLGEGANDLARFAFAYFASLGVSEDARGAECVSAETCGGDEVCARDSDSGSDSRSGSGSGSGPRRVLLGSAFETADGTGNEPRGWCSRSSARFVPALSHRLVFGSDGAAGKWIVAEEDASEGGAYLRPEGGDGADPIWCESDWPNGSGARVYRATSLGFESGVLLAGVAVTTLAFWVTNELDAAARSRFKEE